MKRTLYKPPTFPCAFPGCKKVCKSPSGQTRHRDTCKFNPTFHRAYSEPPLPADFRTPSPDPAAAPVNAPHTPQNHAGDEHAMVPPTPNRGTQRRTIWTTNGRSGVLTRKHPYIDGQPCDKDGNDLYADAPPPPPSERAKNDFSPYESRAEFELADFLYRKEQMSGKKIDQLMDLWAAQHPGEAPPFSNAKDLYNTIDSTVVGDIPWQAFSVTYQGKLPEDTPPPSWMTAKYEVWFRDPLQVLENQIGNPDFDGEIDYAPKQVFGKNKKRQYMDLMSGNWAWEQADIIAEDPETHGAMQVPVIGGSDKTTVSVATGQNDFYPFYASAGNLHNHVRRAHRDGVALVGFLNVPKTNKKYEDDVNFRKFRRQLFHTSLTRILLSLKPHMTTPRITRCADGHFRRVIYDLGPYIADYPEQVLLGCVVSNWCAKCTALSTNLDDPDSIPRSHEHSDAMWDACEGDLTKLWEGYGIVGDLIPFTSQFPRADIHKLLSPDLLHQIIKGAFKDHLVTWVTDYIYSVNSKKDAKDILADIDNRIAAAPLFPGLRRFKEGRGFKQWTGDDSKALMKVYLPAITGHVPPQMVRALSAFMEFCYLVRRSEIDEDTLAAIDDAVNRFHQERVIFLETDIRDHFSLPRQHSMVHYRHLIQQFGAPNGVCSSITESKHIKAVKEPWRRSNKNEPLGQMLLTNQRLDKLAASRIDFQSRGMLHEPLVDDPDHPFHEYPQAEPPPRLRPLPDDDNDEGGDVEGDTSIGDVKLAKCPAKGYANTVSHLQAEIRQPRFTEYIRRYMYDQLHPDSEVVGMDAPLAACPVVSPNLFIKVFNSAVSIYHAPSDLSGVGGMHRERIRAAPTWKGDGDGRNDCIFLDKDSKIKGFKGLHVARVLLFFRFKYNDVMYPSALVQWFSTHGNQPCDETGMWMVEPDWASPGRRLTSVVHVDTILRSAHLIPVFGSQFVPRTLTHTKSLQAFHLYYVNKYADHHAHEIAS